MSKVAVFPHNIFQVGDVPSLHNGRFVRVTEDVVIFDRSHEIHADGFAIDALYLRTAKAIQEHAFYLLLKLRLNPIGDRNGMNTGIQRNFRVNIRNRKFSKRGVNKTISGTGLCDHINYRDSKWSQAQIQITVNLYPTLARSFAFIAWNCPRVDSALNFAASAAFLVAAMDSRANTF